MADRIIFVCILVLAGVYFWATSKIPSLEIGDPLGPKAFPRLLGIGLLITAGILFYEMLQARKSAAVPAQAPAESKDDNRHYYMLAGVTVWTFAYFLVFEPLGYMVATTIYLIGMFAYFHKNRWLMNVVTAVLFSIISYVAFVKLLGVNLARGFLPF